MKRKSTLSPIPQITSEKKMIVRQSLKLMNKLKDYEQFKKEMQELSVQEQQETQKRDHQKKKIELIVDMTQQKLKLVKVSQRDRYNQHFQAVRQLKTFVDYSDKISDTNILNNKDLLNNIKQYQLRRRVSQVEEIKEKVITDIQEDPLFFELEYEGERNYKANELDKNPLKFGQSTQANIPNSPTIKIMDYISTKAVLYKASEPLQKYYQIQADEDDQFIIKQHSNKYLNQQRPNFEDELFYKQVEDKFVGCEKKIFNQQSNKERDLKLFQEKRKQQNQLLSMMAKDYGIDIDEEKSIILSNNERDVKIFKIFKHRSNQIVHQATVKATANHERYLRQREGEFNQNIKQRQMQGIQSYSNQIKQKVKIWHDQKQQKPTLQDNPDTYIQDSTQIKTQNNTINYLEAHDTKSKQVNLKILSLLSIPNTSRSTSYLDQVKYPSQNNSPEMKNSGKSKRIQSQYQSIDVKNYQNKFKSLLSTLDNYEESHKFDEENIETTLRDMGQNIDTIVGRVEEDLRIKSLGMSGKSTQFPIQYRNGESKSKKMVNKNNNRAMKMIKYAD